tara:strand:+ start:113 stop:403 length:291 start_codon:yes stop_codon:yes gene_type:complete
MPDSRIVSIHKKIAELIAVDYSSGFSGIDFTNRVIRAVEIEPIMVPNACVKFIDSKEDYGPTMAGTLVMLFLRSMLLSMEKTQFKEVIRLLIFVVI